MGEHAYIQKDSKSQEELRSIPLAKMSKHYVMVTSSGIAQNIGIRPGGGNKSAEEQLNGLYLSAANTQAGFRGLSTDGIGKDRTTLVKLTVSAWQHFFRKTLTCNAPIGFLDTHHFQKTLAGAFQYGGGIMPHVRGHNAPATNIFLLYGTSIPLEAIRRVDFASSRLPHILAQGAHLEEIAKDMPMGSRGRDIVGTSAYLVAMRAIHFAIFHDDPEFNNIERFELLFLGSILLTDFDMHQNTYEQVILHLFGHGYSLLLHDDVTRPDKNGSLMLEFYFGIIRGMFKGNHKEISIHDALAAQKKIAFQLHTNQEMGWVPASLASLKGYKSTGIVLFVLNLNLMNGVTKSYF